MATYEQIADELREATDAQGLVADGFSDALVGLLDHWGPGGRTTVALYDYVKCVEILVEREGMDRDEAEEMMEINVCGSYVGDHTPAYGIFYRDVRVNDLDHQDPPARASGS